MRSFSALTVMQLQALFNLLLLPLSVSSLPVSNSTTPPGPGEGWDFNFDSITPTPNLTYHPCYDRFECARLLVPLDYTSPSDDRTASIAIIKYPSDPNRYPEYSASWGGPVLLNPGGPGGSGVDFVLQAGEAIGEVLGRQYSIVSFDPRGVNNTRPLVSCFNKPVERQTWAIKGAGKTLGSGGGEEFGEAYIRAKIFGEICNEGENGEMGRFLGTASVARDMLSINDATWDRVPENSGIRKKGLQYWGFSYGTLLGMTFGKMFPDKVERMVLDGVVDALDYYDATWLQNLLDTEVVLDSFYEFCFKAGPLLCGFYTGNKPADIRKRVQKVLTALREQPVRFVPPGSDSQIYSELFTYSDLQQTIFASLYAPILTFPSIASDYLLPLEAAIQTRNRTVEIQSLRKPQPTCPANGEDWRNEQMEVELRAREALPAIACADAAPLTNMTLADLRQHYNKLFKQSPTAAGAWALNGLACLGWRTQAVEKAPRELFMRKSAVGAVPVLFVSTTADPVTPLRNAYAMSKLFKGSKVVVQEGEGHCTITVPSDCFNAIVSEYFKSGMVPEKESERYCARQYVPWIGAIAGDRKRGEKPGTAELMRKVGEAWRKNVGPIDALGEFMPAGRML
ncbi:Alpha/Beta hydrolase protein [Kalaharituber pfeilii]|nr:Alpha/Beta hydrolase protein [Kalaharituber pfeilii]